MRVVTKALRVTTLAAAIGIAQPARAESPIFESPSIGPGSAIWLDSACMTAHSATNPKDFTARVHDLCFNRLLSIWSTAQATAEVTGHQLICSANPVAVEQMELIFSEYIKKHSRTDYQALNAPGSAEKIALAAFMAAYPCR